MDTGFPMNWLVADGVNENFVCPICKDILNDPMQCPNGHLFCNFCILQCMERKEVCPVCKVKILQLGKNIFVRDQVGDLITKCYVIEKQGFLPPSERCQWMGPLHMRMGHVENCNLRLFTCFGPSKPLDLHPDDDCLWKGSSTLRAAHVASCPMRRKVSCPNEKCLLSCPRRGLSRHDLRDHLIYYSKFQTQQIDNLQIEKNRSDVSGFAIMQEFCEDNRIVYCGQVKRIDKKTKEGMGVEVTSGGISGSYAGTFKNGLRHGTGHLEKGWLTYTGQFFEGKMQGKCSSFFDERRYGSGTFVNNQLNGMGKIWSTHGENHHFSYDGEFVEGKRHGKGTQIFNKGTKSFTGQFFEGSICGDGVMTDLKNQHTITGTFEGCYCYGKGVLKDAFGLDIYSGDFVSSEKHGSGVMNYSNGDVYTGTFKKDLKSGQGVLVFADKSQYSGGFLKDKFHGEGVMTDENGVVGETISFRFGVVNDLVEC